LLYAFRSVSHHPSIRVFETKFLDAPSDALPSDKYAWWLSTLVTANNSSIEGGIESPTIETDVNNATIDKDSAGDVSLLLFLKMQDQKRWFQSGHFLDMEALQFHLPTGQQIQLVKE
jgi:hypothetical protein